MKTQLLLIAAFACLLFTSCEYDNYDEPGSTLTGRVVYNGEPVGVRSNGTQLELWEDGHKLYSKIPVHIAQDGTYSAKLFNGSYKLVRLAGAPWEAQPGDTIRIDVKGKTERDVPVTPYFAIRNASFQKGSGTVTAKFTIDKVVASSNVVSVNLYLGKNLLTDQNRNEKVEELNLDDLVLSSETTITAEIPASLLNNDFIFARVGVRSSNSGEYFYTQVEKIALK